MLAEYLTHLRQNARLTLSEWAARSGVSRTTLWRWEQSKALPRDEELRYALDALSASAGERSRARDLLYQERAARGSISPLPPFGGSVPPNDLLRALRLRTNLSQRAAAERLGVNRVTLAGWERGDHWPETTKLHHAGLLYSASPEELIALTAPGLVTRNLPLDPDAVVWDDIETYTGDFQELELRYLASRAQLSRIPHAAAREREITCQLDYLHSLMLQARYGEIRRELKRLVSNPILLRSPLLYARNRRLFAVAQAYHARGNKTAETTLRALLDLGEAIPVAERYRARAEWASRRTESGDRTTAMRMSSAALADANASGDPHLLAVSRREYTAALIECDYFSAAAKALEQFPTHTPLFAVQQVFTHALLLHRAGSYRQAIAAYGDAARAAQAAGMSGYATYYTGLAASLSKD